MIKFNDAYINTVARGLLQADEQLVAATAGSAQSFWTFRIPFFRHNYLLLATHQRLIVVDHRRGLVFDRLDDVQSYRWSEIGAMKLGGLLTKKLVVKDNTNRVLLSAKLPPVLITPIRFAKRAAQTLVQTWTATRQLPAGREAPPGLMAGAAA